MFNSSPRLPIINSAAMSMWRILLVFLLSPSSYAQPTSDTGDSMTNSSCVVPPYAPPLEEVLASDNSTALLLAEGRCYLGCLRNFTEVVQGFPAFGGLHEVSAVYKSNLWHVLFAEGYKRLELHIYLLALPCDHWRLHKPAGGKHDIVLDCLNMHVIILCLFS